MDASLKERIEEARKRRNFLAHDFFRERSLELASRQKRDEMIAELKEAHAMFYAADRALSKFMEPYRTRPELNDEIIEVHIAKIMREIGLNEEDI